jgi:L-asparagine transporter-like permease
MRTLLALMIICFWIGTYVPFREAFSDLTGAAPFFAIVPWLAILLLVLRFSRNLKPNRP